VAVKTKIIFINEDQSESEEVGPELNLSEALVLVAKVYEEKMYKGRPAKRVIIDRENSIL
jgi:hypothetical protein